MIFRSRVSRLIHFLFFGFFLFFFNVSHAQNLEFVDLGVVEGEFKRYNRTLSWTNMSNDSIRVKLWSSDESLSFKPFERPIGSGEEIEIPISITLPTSAGDMEYELRLLDQNDLVLHGFQMSFKVLQSELDVFKAYRNIHFPFRAKEEVFNLKSGQREDTLSATFDVYNLGGSNIKANSLSAGDSIKVSFATTEVTHNAFTKMRIDFVTNDQSAIGFQKRQIKLYNEGKLITVLPVQYTLIPRTNVNAVGPRLSTNLINHDFKVVKVGQTKEVTVSLANRGEQALIIEKIESNCDCLVYNDVERIESGTSQSLRVQFNATDRIGLERKTLAIFSNDSVKPVLVLTFRAHVK
ncbi:DUF1573 domain-containing protein [Roseivirga sp. E12]|uniref:DUF1573 domain-containing protein n=1 Tax=Roseivirga sp. E12 TaxID=2819237 RepID=UPI001ABCC4E1|nr:DUF1573 domain-containing protein [Roseivirga sp. E12]MBO3697610.1 DUF1573 domain-containing protein [Roseivirga sp. E12]